jgi:hypothetical protein
MRDKEIVGLYQAYLDVYSNSNEEVEQLDEDVQGAVDNVTKRIQSGLEKIGFPINRTPKGTPTQAQQERKIKPVGEEVEQLDELSSAVKARARHKIMQNLDAAQRREMDARNVGATMGEISKRSEETSAAAAKFSKHNQLSSRHARSRKRMRDAGQNVNDSYEYEVENWVNSLIEEGYDLSEYTWEDMYEMYLDEERRDPRGRVASGPMSVYGGEGQDAGPGGSGNVNVDRMDAAQRRVKATQPKKKGMAADRLFTQYSARQQGMAHGGEEGPGPKAPKRSGRSGRGANTDRGSGNAAKRRMSEDFDLFDAILGHLVAEGYADTNESALAIMANMSEEWRQSIVEGGTGAFVPSRVDDFNNRRDMLKNRYGQDVSPRIPGPSGGGQGGTTPTTGVLKLARGTSSSKRGVESKNNA